MTDLETRDARLDRILGLVPYGALVFSAAGSPLFPGQTWQAWLITLGLAALTAAWIFGLTGAYKPFTENRRLMLVYCAGLLGLAALLVWRNPIYGFFSWSLYLHMFRYARGPWMWAGFIGTAAVNAASQIGGYPSLSWGPLLTYLGVFAFNVVIVVMVMRAAISGERLSEQRKQANAELEI